MTDGASRALLPLPASVVLRRWQDVMTDGDRSACLDGINRIFRATTARWPDDPQAATRFRDLWLGQYLEHEPDLVTLAMAASGQQNADSVLGYIVGCRIDPATSSRFQSLSYFQDFSGLTKLYPAHLHINLDAQVRGQGIGAHLIEALYEQLMAEGVKGVHAVTGAGLRNVGFYERCGFVERGRVPRGAGEVLFLARPMA